MDLDAIVQDIDAEISRLEKVRALPTRHTSPLNQEAKNQFRPPTLPFDRSFSWQPATIVSTRSPLEAL
jgi:hypothetical protein